jgi:hypothetical protein
MSASLPPKTCSIERMITKEQDIEKVLSGKKTAVRRNGRYADPGETVEWNGIRFEVTRVYSQRLADMTEEDVHAEGFETMEEYRAYITGLHPGMPWMPDRMTVWVHEFRRI